MHFSASLCISLHLSASLCISLHLSASLRLFKSVALFLLWKLAGRQDGAHRAQGHPTMDERNRARQHVADTGGEGFVAEPPKRDRDRDSDSDTSPRSRSVRPKIATAADGEYEYGGDRRHHKQQHPVQYENTLRFKKHALIALAAIAETQENKKKENGNVKGSGAKKAKAKGATSKVAVTKHET